MHPIFHSSQSNSLTRYQRILWGISYGCKNLLNFTCLTMKFHNCHHTKAPAIQTSLKNQQPQNLSLCRDSDFGDSVQKFECTHQSVHNDVSKWVNVVDKFLFFAFWEWVPKLESLQMECRLFDQSPIFWNITIYLSIIVSISTSVCPLSDWKFQGTHYMQNLF